MLVSVFGTSTPYAYWGFSIIEHILNVLYGNCYRIHCLTLEELSEAWKNREGRPVLITSDRPDPGLTHLVVRSEFPCIVFTDDPEDCILLAAKHRKLSNEDAIRFSTRYFCSLEGALCAPGVCHFGSDYYYSDSVEFIREIMRSVKHSFDQAAFQQVLQRAIPDYRPGERLTVGQAMLRHTTEARPPGQSVEEEAGDSLRLIRAVAGAYRPIFQRRELSRLEWPVELFYTDPEKRDAAGNIELAGGSRFLVWGPYFFLPVGQWQARLQFEVADNLSGNEAEVDICIGLEVISRGAFTLPTLGSFELSIKFGVIDPGFPIEVRVRTSKGAIEGQFRLNSVNLSRLNNSTVKEISDRRTPA